MSETIDILIHVSEEELAQAKQAEDQRANITSLILIIASAIQGGLTQTGLTRSALPLTITLILLGIFGAVAVEKLYEHFQRHIQSDKQIRKRLEELYPDTQLKTISTIARETNRAKHPRWIQPIPLHIIWVSLHTFIAILGLIYTIIALLH